MIQKRKTRTTINEPEKLRPYLVHGVNLSYTNTSKEAVGECPFCNRVRKFSVKVATGQYKCFVCKESGNTTDFIRYLYDLSLQNTKPDDYVKLAKDRRFKNAKTVELWGAALSVINDSWLVPGFSADKELKTLYIWGDKLFPTPTLGHYIQGMYFPNGDDYSEVYITEGFWDGVALSEVCPESTIVSLPGVNVFYDDWLRLFKDKEVSIMFDNDHPKKKDGKLIPPAGYEGTQTVAANLGKIPSSVHYLKWGPKGYDRKIPHKTDLRDYLGGTYLDIRSRRAPGRRSKAFKDIAARITPVPSDWLTKPAKRSSGVASLDPIPCDSWDDVIEAWKEALEWTEGLEKGLTCMIACAVSTQTVDDQLWVKVISPPSTGKSTLCEALSVSKKYVVSKSTIRGFHSGFGSSEEDASLVKDCDNRTLIIKDGDTLLKSPNFDQILSEARDIYDTVSRTHYRTGKSNDYEGLRMSWILAGTHSLREIDESELGERFLDCIIMDDIDTRQERKIGNTKASKVIFNINKQPKKGELSTNYSPEQVHAMCITAGYLEYLRDNSGQLFGELRDTLIKKSRKEKQDLENTLVDMALFVAYMRARPVRGEKGSREMCPRLTGQITKLTLSIALTLGETDVTDSVLRQTAMIALDTSRGLSYDIVDAIFSSESDGLSCAELSKITNTTPSKVEEFLKFLVRLKAINYNEVREGRSRTKRYKLGKIVERLYRNVTQYI